MANSKSQPNYISLKDISLLLQQRQNLRESLKKKDLPDTDRRRFQFHYEEAEEKLDLYWPMLPHGSGLDNGMEFKEDESNDKKLVFNFGFHHMDDHGGYDRWTFHNLILTPKFGDFDMHITGRDFKQIKEYLYDLFSGIFAV